VFQLVLDKNNCIIKKDKVFKSKYTSISMNTLYNISGSAHIGSIKSGNCYYTQLTTISGEQKYALISCTVQNNDSISVRGLEVSNEIEQVFRIRNKLTIDAVTGLKNQNYLEEIFNTYVTEYGKELLMFRISICNIEGYQVMLGSYFVDDIKMHMASLIKRVFGGNDVFHVSNGEYIVVRRGGEYYQNEILKKVDNEIKGVHTVNGRMVSLDVRTACVSFRDSGNVSTITYDTAMHATSVAISYAIRNSFGHQYEIDYFAEHIPTDFAAKGVISRMIDKGDFDVYYQPQYELATGEIVCFEALLRIVSEEKKYISTLELVKTAEKHGGILELGNFVFHRALEFAKKMQAISPKAQLSINVSTVQLLESGFVNWFIQGIKDAKVKPSVINVEITESAMMYSIEEILPKLKLLINAGIGIHIDDFGTGYSSLAYLKRIPSSVIKIDKTFIDDISDSAMIVDNIILMAKKLRKTVVAEGVETEKQLETLRKLNCDVVQGFIYSKAVPDSVALRLLAGNEA